MSGTAAHGGRAARAAEGWTPGSVALVHDYLNQRGGAERVALELARMWPQAPLHTSLYRARSTFPEFDRFDIRTSPLNVLPVDRGFRALAPLLPLAFRSLGELDHELVISSSSGWAHGIHTSSSTLHVVYCHNPARWLYAARTYLGPRRGAVVAPLLEPLRRWDQAAARRPDAYIANSQTTRARIRNTYGLESVVVHPPVDTERFTPRPRGERLLVVSRLLPYKRVDLVVQAAKRVGIGLDVVGDGPELPRIRALADSQVVLHGKLDERALIELMEGCRAVCVPGAEDFGIVAIEALAAGKPVVAFAGGGALETLTEGVSAALFQRQSVEDVLEAIRRADVIETPPEELAHVAARFSVPAFREKLWAAVRAAYEASAAR